MSENSKDEETADAVAAEPVPDEAEPEEPAIDATSVAEPPSGSEPSPEPETTGSGDKPGRTAAGPSWLALFLSFVALAAAGYMFMENWRAQKTTEASDDTIARLSDRLDESQQSLSELDSSLSDLTSHDQATRSRVESLQQGLDARLQLLDSLPGRMSNLENSVSALQGVSAGARDTWLLAEAEYYMQIANAQLQLGNNPHLAGLALGMADERVVQMANPALTEVRRAIADELAALDAMEKPDIEGVSLTLASLARVVEALPLRRAAADTAEDEEAGDEELSGSARAWASVKGAMAGLVKVTPPDEATRTLLTADTAKLVRSNLALQLQAARLALLRGEQAIFEQSLDDADALLVNFFDTDSAQVVGAHETIAEIRDSMLAVTPPDISESLRLLRQFRVLSESAQ